ncbi:ATPase inhibitor A, mitochondrial-like [Carcharodon carcharias]|uniref:ATPase inhibitor A, mitochondrial-like n=1 Tax=Carcharodon carcharias TaxID=13397 RepID=UPI001B7DEC71|nr:ATPase inhibitor A, mitochondrial-like [Carcharodon carcharias]
MASSPLGGCLRSILLKKGWAGSVVGQSRQVSAGERMESNGTVRQGGGAFAKREEALEEMYFKRKEKELLDALKSHHEGEITAQKKEIERLQGKIEWHKGKLENLTKQKSSDD